MICSTLNQLYQLSQEKPGWISSAELVRIVCQQCNETEVCPAVGDREYDGQRASVFGKQIEVRHKNVQS